MGTLDIRFISANQSKIDEVTAILKPIGVTVIPINFRVEEIQTENAGLLVKDKTMRAFSKVGRPLFVEHTGLYLAHLNGLPGGLTQIFWDKLEADRFAELFGKSPDPRVTAKTIIGYTDARSFQTFEGEIAGRIAPAPRGSRTFQWDCVFIPDGYSETFAELGPNKSNISMRRRALDKFAEFLVGRAVEHD